MQGGASLDKAELKNCYKTFNGSLSSEVENVLTFELNSIYRIDCNLVIWWIESKHLKMPTAIWIIEC